MPALAACQALLVMNTAMMVSIGTLAADTLATQKFLVTLPATAYIVGGGLAAMPISLLMKRRGRRAGFMIGCVAGILGGTLAAIAVALHNFWLLCGAALVSGIYNGAGGYYRFAAADTAPATLRSRAISLVLAGGIVGGVLGPESSKFTRDWFGPLFLGSFVSLILLATIALAVVRHLQLPMLSEEERRGPTRNLAAIMRQPVFVVSVLGAITAYGVMNLLMAATPLAMTMCAHPYGAAMLVIEWHIIAMFAPAFFTGWLIVRIGVLPVMFAGTLMMAAAIAIATHSITVSAFWWSMVLIGLGWCCLFVGATTLLTEACTPAEKAKTQGMNDLLIYSTMGVTSLSSGAILYHFGWNTLNASALPLLILTATAIVWLAAHRRTERQTGQDRAA